jgi:hypothetical protein
VPTKNGFRRHDGGYIGKNLGIDVFFRERYANPTFFLFGQVGTLWA